MLQIVLRFAHFSCSHKLQFLMQSRTLNRAFLMQILFARRKTTAKLISPGESRQPQADKILLFRIHLWTSIVLEIYHFQKGLLCKSLKLSNVMNKQVLRKSCDVVTTFAASLCPWGSWGPCVQDSRACTRLYSIISVFASGGDTVYLYLRYSHSQHTGVSQWVCMKCGGYRSPGTGLDVLTVDNIQIFRNVTLMESHIKTLQ